MKTLQQGILGTLILSLLMSVAQAAASQLPIPQWDNFLWTKKVQGKAKISTVKDEDIRLSKEQEDAYKKIHKLLELSARGESANKLSSLKRKIGKLVSSHFEANYGIPFEVIVEKEESAWLGFSSRKVQERKTINLSLMAYASLYAQEREVNWLRDTFKDEKGKSLFYVNEAEEKTVAIYDKNKLVEKEAYQSFRQLNYLNKVQEEQRIEEALKQSKSRSEEAEKQFNESAAKLSQAFEEVKQQGKEQKSISKKELTTEEREKKIQREQEQKKQSERFASVKARIPELNLKSQEALKSSDINIISRMIDEIKNLQADKESLTQSISEKLKLQFAEIIVRLDALNLRKETLKKQQIQEEKKVIKGPTHTELLNKALAPRRLKLEQEEERKREEENRRKEEEREREEENRRKQEEQRKQEEERKKEEENRRKEEEREREEEKRKEAAQKAAEAAKNSPAVVGISSEALVPSRMSSEIKNALNVLQLPVDGMVTKDMITKNFRKLARQSHPDKSIGSHEKMSPVNQARDLLLSNLDSKGVLLPPPMLEDKSIKPGMITWQNSSRSSFRPVDVSRRPSTALTSNKEIQALAQRERDRVWLKENRGNIIKGLRSDYIQNTLGSRISVDNQINQSNFKQKIEAEMRPEESREAAIRSSREQLALTIKRPVGRSDRRPSTRGKSRPAEVVQEKVDADAMEGLWNEKYKPLKTGAHVSAMIKGERKWPIMLTSESSRDQQISRRPAIVTHQQVEKIREEEKRKEAAQKAAEAAKNSPAVVGDPMPVTPVLGLNKEERAKIVAGLRSSWMERCGNFIVKFKAPIDNKNVKSFIKFIRDAEQAERPSKEMQRKDQQRALQDSKINYKDVDLSGVFSDDEETSSPLSPKGSPVGLGGSRGLGSPVVKPLDLGLSASGSLSSFEEKRKKIVRGLRLLHDDDGFFSIKNPKVLERKCKAALEEISSLPSLSSSPHLSPIRSSIDARPRTPEVRSRTPGRSRSLEDLESRKKTDKSSEYLDLARSEDRFSRRSSAGRRPASPLHSSVLTPRSTPGSPLSRSGSPLLRMYDFSNKEGRDLAVAGLRDPWMQKMGLILEVAGEKILQENISTFAKYIAGILFDPNMPIQGGFEQVLKEARKYADKKKSKGSPSSLSSPDYSGLPGFFEDDDEFSLPASTSSSSSSSSEASSSSGAAKHVDDYFTFNQGAFERMMQSK